MKRIPLLQTLVHAIAYGMFALLPLEAIATETHDETQTSDSTVSSPNIILIVSDDQGYADLGCYGGGEAKTPNLDKLAKRGTLLTNFYVSWPACTPSRGSLLTGRYPQRHGVYDMIRDEAPDYGYKYTPEEYAVTFERIGGMDTREVLLPRMLKQAGYRSGIFGKWDLGVQRRFLPKARGFDDFYGFVNTGIDYFTHERYGVPSMYRGNNPTEEDKGTYCTKLFLRESLRFLDECNTGGDAARPFFLYVPFNAPHNASNLDPTIRSGAQGTDEFKSLYPDLQSKAGLVAGKKYGKPATVRNRESRRLEYLASVTEMDAAIGELLLKVDQMGKTQETIVVFLSDNGGGGAANNAPLRGRKAQLWEGGIRVPAIVAYPGIIPEGATNDGFCTAMDLLPTLCRWCSVSTPANVKLDGIDITGMLSGQEASPRKQMFWKRRSDKAARIGNWKWLESASGSGLFNLETDIGEKKDLSATHPEKLEQMRSAFNAWESEMDAADPRGPFRDF